MWEDLVIRQIRQPTRDTPPTVETMMALEPPLCGAAVFELYVTLSILWIRNLFFSRLNETYLNWT